jgi:CRP/FNR family cyclic AMP-dependent transcriptional regulator
LTKKEGIALLRSVPMFAEFSQRDLGKLWDHMKIVTHDDGHRITAEGRGGQGFHLILDGSVRVVRKSKRLMLGRGDFFGEMALIDDGPRTATVTAVGPTATATMSAWEFKSVVKQQPDLLWKLLVHTTVRLREEQSVTASLTS